jgi:hypothetical protein
MSVNSKVWGAVETIITAASVTTGTLSTAVDLVTLGYEGAQVAVDADFTVTPTDDLIVEVFASLDGTDYDDTPLFTQEIDKDTDPNQITIPVFDLAFFKVNVKRSGSTDTITVTVKVRPWRWNNA